MAKKFNVTGACIPQKHYMVELTSRLKEIKAMIDDEEYFTINKGRQYGKTTILRALAEYLKDYYTILALDFQKLSFSDFENESAFVAALAREVSRKLRNEKNVPNETKNKIINCSSRIIIITTNRQH